MMKIVSFKSLTFGTMLVAASIAGDITSNAAVARSEAELRQLAYQTYFEAMSKKKMEQLSAKLKSLTPNEAKKIAKYAREIAQTKGQSSTAMQSAGKSINIFENRLMEYISTEFGPNKTIWNLTTDELTLLDEFAGIDGIAKSSLDNAIDTIQSGESVRSSARAASGCTYDASWPNKFKKTTPGGGYLPSGTGRVYNTPGEKCDFKATISANKFKYVYGVSPAMHTCVISWGGYNGLSAKSDYSAAIVGYGRLAACTAGLGLSEWYVKNYLAFKK